MPIYQIEDWKIYDCPAKLISEETEEFLMLYGMSKLMNTLPESGGVMDQIGTFYHGAMVIESVSNEVAEQQMKAK